MSFDRIVAPPKKSTIEFKRVWLDALLVEKVIGMSFRDLLQFLPSLKIAKVYIYYLPHLLF